MPAGLRSDLAHSPETEVFAQCLAALEPGPLAYVKQPPRVGVPLGATSPSQPTAS